MIATLAGCNSNPSPSQTDGTTDGNDTPIVANTGEKLGRNVIEWMKQGVYSLSFTLELKYPDFEYELECVLANDGNNSVFQSEGNVPLNGYLKTRIMTKDGYGYIVDDGQKTYTAEPDYGDGEEESTDFTGMELTGSGNVTFKGLSCSYEDYQTGDGVMRFYFNAQGNLIAFEAKATTVDSTLQGSMEGTAIYMMKGASNTPPSSLFDIPADYKKLD